MDTQEKRELSRSIDYKNTFSTEHGKRVLADLTKQYLFNVGANMDTAMFNEGAKHVIVSILTHVGANEEYLINLIKEGNKHGRRDNFDSDGLTDGVPGI